MMGRPRLQVNASEFKKMYHSGASISEVADHFKISVSTVRKIRLRLNIPVRRGRFNEEEYRRLFNLGISYPEMGRCLGISKWYIMEIRKQLNLPNRKRGQKRVR